jgi:hypothetical protein
MAIQSFFAGDAAHSLRLFSRVIGLLMMTMLAPSAGSGAPKYDHVLVVIMENHSFEQIQAASDAVYLHELEARGAVFLKSFAITSQPTELFRPLQRLDARCSGRLGS